MSFTQLKPRSKISLNALRTFEAAARHSSMTAAADELSVTPGAVSRQISDLQNALSFTLYDGPQNARTTTAAGLRLASTLTKALDEIDATLLALDATRDRLLDVSCLSTSAVRWLIPRLHRFRDKYPELDLRLSTDPRRPDKMVNRVDVSIMVLSPREKVGRQDTVLFAEALGPVLKPSIIEQGQVVDHGDLLRFLRLTTKTRPQAWDDWQGARQSCPPASVHMTEFDHLSLAIEAAINGLGVCITPEHLVNADIANGRLAAPFGFHESGYTYVIRAHGRRKPKVTAFVEWLSKDAGDLP